jgi:protein ImuA
MGLSLRRLIVLRVPRPRDALWAMEEALQCRAAGAVVTELMGDDGDLTATRGWRPRPAQAAASA